MKKVTVKAISGKTLVYFNVNAMEKTTMAVELFYQKKNGGDATVIIPWSIIETMYICEQNDVLSN